MHKNAVIQFLVGAGLLAGATSALAAPNLEFCSNGNPAGFTPDPYTP